MLLTFVVPAYNASKTIRRCLDSIYSLPLKENEYETFVIDDCSTDDTIEIVEGYQEEHDNLVLFCQQQNHRQGAARNIGIDKTTGDYIVFVDSDDEVSEGLLRAVTMADTGHFDMVVMRVVKVSGEGKVESEMSLSYQAETVFSGVELQTEYPFWGTAPWPYVYRRSFLKEVNYPFAEDVLFEDSDFVNVHLYHAQKMAYCNTCGYRVHCNADSTTHTLSYKHVADYALLGTRMLAFYESLPDKTTKYANTILEGGSFNVMKSFRRLFLLGSTKEIHAFYDRIDARFDRKRLLIYRTPAYCWTRWTRFGLKYRGLCVFLLFFIFPILNLFRK